jgi:hypothetical protein
MECSVAITFKMQSHPHAAKGVPHEYGANRFTMSSVIRRWQGLTDASRLSAKALGSHVRIRLSLPRYRRSGIGYAQV